MLNCFLFLLSFNFFSISTYFGFDTIKYTEHKLESIKQEESNPLSRYLADADMQYETEEQGKNIAHALKDALTMPAKLLKKQRYNDYTGKPNCWDLHELIFSHFISGLPEDWQKNFYKNIKKKSTQIALQKHLKHIEK